MKKICQACHTVNDMEATQCIGCGRKFIDPKKIKRKRVVKYSLLGALGLFILLYFGVFLLGSNAHKPSDPILRYFSLLE